MGRTINSLFIRNFLEAGDRVGDAPIKADDADRVAQFNNRIGALVASAALAKIAGRGQDSAAEFAPDIRHMPNLRGIKIR